MHGCSPAIDLFTRFPPETGALNHDDSKSCSLRHRQPACHVYSHRSVLRTTSHRLCSSVISSRAPPFVWVSADQLFSISPPQTDEVPLSPASITFGEFSHVDELTAQLEVLLNQICLDLYYNYSLNSHFHATYTEAYSLYQTTRYIHASEHNDDRQAVRRRLGGANALFHHIQKDVCGWHRVPRRQIGTLGIIAKLEMAEETLHHLMEDVGVSVTDDLEAPTLRKL
jgi:hypothetical protein